MRVRELEGVLADAHVELASERLSILRLVRERRRIDGGADVKPASGRGIAQRTGVDARRPKDDRKSGDGGTNGSRHPRPPRLLDGEYAFPPPDPTVGIRYRDVTSADGGLLLDLQSKRELRRRHHARRDDLDALVVERHRR